MTTKPHPWYGECDALGPNNTCAECRKPFKNTATYTFHIEQVHIDAKIEPLIALFLITHSEEPPYIVDQYGSRFNIGQASDKENKGRFSR